DTGVGTGTAWSAQRLGWSAAIVAHAPRYQQVWAPTALPPEQLAWAKEGWVPPGFRVLPRRWVVEGTQPHYLQDTLDVQERGAHYWAHRAAEPPSCGNETASSSGPGLPGRWCAMSVVTAANAACSFLTSTVVPAEPSDRDASGPPRPRRRRR